MNESTSQYQTFTLLNCFITLASLKSRQNFHQLIMLHNTNTMKKYILLFFFTLIHLLPKHAFSSYELIGYELGSSPKPFTEEEKLLNKIEAIQEKLDELVSENELSQSLALTASGVLATFAFGIFRMISFAQSDTKEPIYNWELDDE